MDDQIHKLMGDEVYAWIEQGSSIMLKAATAHGDPVEMQWTEARQLAHLLLRLADEGEQGN
jgi:hypothetical protein